uniref:Box C/D snoRNA protein 1 n=1 Tax=Mucochytrium quahogii TaxID=96639 RepID=A0A7S2R9K0_9STRA|mmetsp:Transcript_9396/g.15327  ORF Transcript_9396/g.15327 Transcript_9396/m.15327 type:complete len:320 (-) Transcript_9396:27-986(-)
MSGSEREVFGIGDADGVNEGSHVQVSRQSTGEVVDERSRLAEEQGADSAGRNGSVETTSVAGCTSEDDAREKEEGGDDKNEPCNSLCAVCDKVEYKYRCPRCSTQTCSLHCVKKHKETTGCSGVRDKTKFVDIKEFSDKTLRSDLRFLEEVEREADSAKRDISSVGADMNDKSRHTKRSRNSFYKLPRRLQELVKQAEFRGVELLLMPNGMTRRKENTTYFERKSQEFNWCVEWCTLKDGEMTRIAFLERVPDKNTLIEALELALKVEDNRKLRAFKTSKSFTIKTRDGTKQVDGVMTLAECLKGCTVVEFPVIVCNSE